MATKTKEKDLFEDVETEEIVEAEVADDLEERDDLKEGMMAEADPATQMVDPLAAHKGKAEDVVTTSLNNQLTALGRKTAEKLNELPKVKVVIPYKELNPHDKFLVVGTNGWNTQISRGKAVMLPEEIVHRLTECGENPTIVR